MPTPITVKARLDLGRWTEAPYMYPHACDRIEVPYPSDPNVDYIKVFLVGIDEERAPFTETAGTFPRPKGSTVKYAQSQAINNGLSAVVDTGEDAFPTGPVPPKGDDGISPATMIDPERVMAFQLLPTRTAMALEYEIRLFDDSLPVTLPYPTFHWPNVKVPKLVVENSRVQTLLWANGPGLRLGQNYWYDGFSLNNPPAVAGMGTVGTIIDWLCNRRVLFQGVAYNGGTPDLATELTQLFNFFEGQSVAVVDKNSLAVVLPPRGGVKPSKIRAALINTIAEVPPLACFPVPQRGSDWKYNNTFAQTVYDWSEEARHHINPAPDAADVFTPDGSTQWTVVDSTISGWQITKHTHVVDNTEHAGFLLNAHGKTWAEVSPWHGVFSSLYSAPPVTTGGINHLQRPDGKLHLATIEDSNIWVRSSDHTVPIWRSTVKVTTTGDCTSRPWLYFDWTTRRTTVLFARDNHNCYESHSDDDGRTWSAPTLTMSGVSCPSGVGSQNGYRAEIYGEWVSGTSGPMKVALRYLGPGDSTWNGPIYITDSSGDPLIAEDGKVGNLQLAWVDHEAWTFVITIDGESVPSTWFCTAEEGAQKWTFTRL